MSKLIKIIIKIGVWLKRYWYIPLFLVVTLITWLLFRRTEPIFGQTVAEVRAIQAEADAAKLKAELGTEKAKIAVTEKYQTELRKLNDEQLKEAKALSNDPAKLAKFLVRAASSSTTR
jgi:hypothetical protein